MDKDGVCLCVCETPWQRRPSSDLRIRVLAPAEAPDVPIFCLGAFPVTVALVESQEAQGTGRELNLDAYRGRESLVRTSREVDIVTTTRSPSARPRHPATPLCSAIDITTTPWRPFATLPCLCLFLLTAAASSLLD